MVNFLSIPQLEIKNTLLDTRQLGQALDNYGDVNRQLEQRDFQRQQAEEQKQYSRGRAAKSDAMETADRIGKMALAGDTIQDPAQRAAFLQNILKQHPNGANLGPEYRDPDKAFKLIAAEAGQFRDPREDQLANLKVQNAQLDNQYRQAQIAEMKTKSEGSGGLPIDKRANVEEGLRKEVASTNKDYAIIRDASSKIEAFANNPSAASDVALIYSFMKVLDPTSVVRETEYATAQNAAGVPDQVRNVFNRILSGERLSPEQRKDFTSQAMTAARSQRQQYERSLKQYEGVAERLGVDKRNVILDYGQDQARAEARDAIARGAPRDKVIQRLIENNVDPTGL